MDKKTIGLLTDAVRRREPMRRFTDALRLVNGLGDGLNGLVLEQYGRHFAAQVFHERWLKEKDGLIEFVKTRCQGRYLIVKDRTKTSSSRPDAFKTGVWISDAVSQTVVREHGLKFGVDLNDTLNSGLFLDMRRNRKTVSALAAGAKVLNCFAYTCSFGVYCRAAGASSVVNVDISAKSLSRGRSNYELNGLAPISDEMIRADALRYLKRAVLKNNRFDLIILDPPSFARHDGKSFSVKKDFSGLIDSALKVLNPGGALFASTNFTGLSSHDLEKMARASSREREIRKVQHLGQDEDFVGSGRMPESHLAAVLVKI
jgi:23S rRNA (cytosine1962-C5)-methyltransferase